MRIKDRILTLRTPKKSKGPALSVLAAAGCLLFGILLGVFAKWLDNLSLDSIVWWMRLIERLDLGNVFSTLGVWLLLALTIAIFSRTPVRAAVHTFLFFAGMCAAYHLYTITFSGFAPTRYMLIWYALTAASPLLAVLCWYAKGTHALSIVLDAVILAVLASYCFSVGWLYFSFDGVLNALFFLAAAVVLYSSPKQTAIAVVAGLALSFPLSGILPH